MDQDGVSGGDRPKPTAAGQSAPAPEVGAAEPDDGDRNRKKGEQRAEAAPVPGFSLK
jgi:pilus assembly protein CpaC